MLTSPGLHLSGGFLCPWSIPRSQAPVCQDNGGAGEAINPTEIQIPPLRIRFHLSGKGLRVGTLLSTWISTLPGPVMCPLPMPLPLHMKKRDAPHVHSVMCLFKSEGTP